jgi:hypothetical protein
VAIVAHLHPRIDFLARLAVGGAEVTIVEHHTAKPASQKCSAKRSRYISLTAEKPCAITIAGALPLARSGV